MGNRAKALRSTATATATAGDAASRLFPPLFNPVRRASVFSLQLIDIGRL